MGAETLITSGSVFGEQATTYANEQWLPAHVTREEAVEIVLDQFKRTIAQALGMMEVRVETSDK